MQVALAEELQDKLKQATVALEEVQERARTEARGYDQKLMKVQDVF